MSKSSLLFLVLAALVAVTVWFVIRKTEEVSEAELAPIATPVVTSTPEVEASEMIQYDNGLVVQDIAVGDGEVVENGDTLTVHYVGALEDGTIFDSSYERGQPIQFVIGSGQLIQGWELGLIGMKDGSKRRLKIPPSLGYGDKGAGGLIPPNAILFFEVDLVGVVKK